MRCWIYVRDISKRIPWKYCWECTPRLHRSCVIHRRYNRLPWRHRETDFHAFRKQAYTGAAYTAGRTSQKVQPHRRGCCHVQLFPLGKQPSYICAGGDLAQDRIESRWHDHEAMHFHISFSAGGKAHRQVKAPPKAGTEQTSALLLGKTFQPYVAPERAHR